MFRVDSTHEAHERDDWRVPVNKVMTLRIP